MGEQGKFSPPGLRAGQEEDDNPYEDDDYDEDEDYDGFE